MFISIIFALIFGLLVGSFLNVVIYRLPVMMENDADEFVEYHLKKKNRVETTSEAELELPSNDTTPTKPTFNLLTPPSRCGNCGSAVRPWQNIPIISWLILKGKCGTCKTSISMRYPLVELLTGVLFAIVAWQYDWDYVTVWGCILTAFIIAMVFIDADTQLLPDDLTIPLVWLGLLFNWHTGFIPLEKALLGVVVGYMSLWIFFHVYKLLTGKEGMGYGDFKMLAAIGAWAGMAVLPIVLISAALIGIIAALIKGVKKGQPMAFGPCLGVAGWFVFLFHEQVMRGIHIWLTASGF